MVEQDDPLAKAREAFYSLHADATVTDESDDGGEYYRYLITGRSLRDLMDALAVPRGALDDTTIDRLERAMDPECMVEEDKKRRENYEREMAG